MDRYGLASGKNFVTITDRELDRAHIELSMAMTQALNPKMYRGAAQGLDRNVKEATRRLVRAALDVERQRCFEKGIEAFAAMPMVRERNVTIGPGFWTGD